MRRWIVRNFRERQDEAEDEESKENELKERCAATAFDASYGDPRENIGKRFTFLASKHRAGGRTVSRSRRWKIYDFRQRERGYRSGLNEGSSR